MAAILFILATYVLLLSLILAAAASGEYYPVVSSETPKPQPTLKAEPYGSSSNSKAVVTKPQEPKNETPNTNSPKPTQPNTSQQNGQYSEKPNMDLPNIPKPEPIKPEMAGYGPKPDYGLTVPKLEKPELNIPKAEEYGNLIHKKLEDAFPSAVEGTVICRSGSNYVPVKGAVVRITCWGVDEEGYDINTLSCQSGPTDAKGYFFKTLHSTSSNHVWGNCKAFLEQSSLEDCSVPSDVNRGISGSLLSTYHILHDKSLKLFSVGPFFYTSDHLKPSPAADGY